MTEPKFTPGPWIFAANSVWTISSAAHSGTLMGNETYYPWVPEKKADWHLIAAAPDLYEALENLENDDGAIPDHAWKLVQAALAKARGESHD